MTDLKYWQGIIKRRRAVKAEMDALRKLKKERWQGITEKIEAWLNEKPGRKARPVEEIPFCGTNMLRKLELDEPPAFCCICGKEMNVLMFKFYLPQNSPLFGDYSGVKPEVDEIDPKPYLWVTPVKRMCDPCGEASDRYLHYMSIEVSDKIWSAILSEERRIRAENSPNYLKER